MDIFNILNIGIGIGTVIILPSLGMLFKQFAAVRSEIAAQDAKIRVERDERQRLELMIAREYVSQIALEKIMAPINKDMANMERLIERIANKLVIPAIHEE